MTENKVNIETKALLMCPLIYSELDHLHTGLELKNSDSAVFTKLDCTLYIGCIARICD